MMAEVKAETSTQKGHDMAAIPESKAKTGELVTTRSAYGGVGLGRLVNGQVYRSGGNGFYYPADEGPGGLKDYERDGGAGYYDRLRGLMLPPAYLR
jgi:hypothetical protein